ncbi:unnamed protein product [Leuciscus chuanchicus]
MQISYHLFDPPSAQYRLDYAPHTYRHTRRKYIHRGSRRNYHIDDSKAIQSIWSTTRHPPKNSTRKVDHSVIASLAGSANVKVQHDNNNVSFGLFNIRSLTNKGPLLQDLLSDRRHVREGVREQPDRHSAVGGQWTAARRPLDDFSGPGRPRRAGGGPPRGGPEASPRAQGPRRPRGSSTKFGRFARNPGIGHRGATPGRLQSFRRAPNRSRAGVHGAHAPPPDRLFGRFPDHARRPRSARSSH